MVPGSTLMYGSSLMLVTLMPRDSRIAAREAAAIPLPREETTPPVTNTYLVIRGTNAVKAEVYSCFSFASIARRQNSTPQGAMLAALIDSVRISSVRRALYSENCGVVFIV